MLVRPLTYSFRQLRGAAVIGGLLMLTACALPKPVGESALSSDLPPLQTTDDAAGGVYRDLISNMLDQGQYYAALAHVQQRQRTHGNTDELRYLEAEARRQLGQFEAADTLYKSLLKGRYGAQAYHGMGLLYAQRGLLSQSLGYLSEAAQRRPADADLRNDYGYALMRAGRYPPAMVELSTAVELAPQSGKATNNLMLLLMLMGDETAVRQLATEAAMPADAVARLRRQAMSFRPQTRVSGGVQ